MFLYLAKNTLVWYWFYRMSFFVKHLLGRLLEIGTPFVIELLFGKSSSTLCLTIFHWRRLVCSRSLLHTHHGSWLQLMIVCSTITLSSTHACVHTRVEAWCPNSTFTRHYRIFVLIRSLWLLLNDIKNTIPQPLFILTQPILFPGKIEYLAIQIIPFHTLIEKAN